MAFSLSVVHHLRFHVFSSVVLLLIQAATGNHMSSSCFPPDRAALLAFAAAFNSTITPFFHTHWNPHLDCCSWQGVACSHPILPSHATRQNFSRVIGLSLGDQGLYAQLSPALCRLSALSVLNMTMNSFYGPIPSCIGHNLSHITYLDLSLNSFNGTMPMFFNTPSLQYFDVSGNQLFGPIPPLNNTPSLEYLDVSTNQFLGPIPPFNNTPSLEYLDVSYNQFFGPIPPFNNTPHLQFLGLSDNQWTGDVSSLSHLQQLYILNLGSTSISARGSSIVQLFCDLISLRSLSIQDSLNVFGTLDHQLPCEKPSVNLIFLDLSACRLRGRLPPWMGLFSNLQVLDLSSNNFTGSLLPPEWQSLSQLIDLRLSFTSPSPDQQLGDWLFRLPLQTLTLTSMGLITQDLLPCESRLSLLNHTLEDLDLSENHLSDGQSLWHCFAHHNFTSLSFLTLSSNPLSFNLSRAHPLSTQSLDLSNCQLFGTLTKEMLASAGYLFLSKNDLSGSIPSDLNPTNLSLRWLDVSFNNLRGPFPSWLGKLPNCNGIVLHDNHLDGEISTQLGPEPSFPNLEVLLLGHNHFSKAVFNHIYKFSLLFLDLSFNQLEGDLQALLGDHSVLFNLWALLLSNNTLSGSIPASLGQSAPYLIILELSFNHLTGGIPESLKFLQALQSTEIAIKSFKALEYSNMKYFDLQTVKNVRFRGNRLLGYMDLSSNLLTDSIPQGLGELVGLNDLNLSRNQLSGHIPSSLGNLRYLESLDLSYNQLQGSIPTSLTWISTLEVFNVSFNPELSGQIP